MLVLSRKLNEEIVIGHTIRIRLLKAGRGRVRLGVSAPRETPVRRAELMAADSPNCFAQQVSGAANVVAEKSKRS
jgi:carbon storage regulator